MTNAEARFSKSLRPRTPEGTLGRTAQDVHLDSHTAPELWSNSGLICMCFTALLMLRLPHYMQAPVELGPYSLEAGLVSEPF